jgi:hypothetical protein
MASPVFGRGGADARPADAGTDSHGPTDHPKETFKDQG